MMKHVSLEDYRILSITTAAIILPAHPAARAAAAPHGAIGFFTGLEKVQEISDLMCDVLASLEVVNILQEEVHAVVSIEDH